MKKRKLSEEEQELWKKVARTTERLEIQRPKALSYVDQPLPIPEDVPTEQKPIAPFSIGSRATIGPRANVLSPSIKEDLNSQPVQMDKKIHTRMRRGKLVPEARIDLHGMTLEQAHPALIGFVQRSFGKGLRLVLVITGKGKSKPDFGPIPERKGVLKHNVPQWLRMAPLSGIVMQVSEAHLKHGGSGAYYVYLRRVR